VLPHALEDSDEDERELAMLDELDDGLLGTLAIDEDEMPAELELDVITPPQMEPVTVGVSTAPLVLTCNPKDTVCPGWTLPFQLKLDAA
jgi:hypothetical protein